MENRMLASGHTVKPVETKEYQDQKENFLGYERGLCRLNPGNWLFPNEYIPYFDSIYNFKFKPTDVLIVTYPKCGTTWMQEIVWTMLNNSNLNNPMAKMGVNMRTHFLELDALASMGKVKPMTSNPKLMQIFTKMCPGKDTKDGILLQMAAVSPDPRTIKCHLPLSLMHPSLLEKCRVIYLARNPKDVVTSFLHHSRLMKSHGYVGTTDKFVDYFVNDDLIYSPYGLHLKEAENVKKHKNMHFMYFEDLKANPKQEIQKLDKFLGTKMNEDQISNVVDYTSFTSMKSRDNLMDGDMTEFVVESVLKNEGGFFRKGETGSFKEKLTAEQESKIEKWTNENAPQIPFKYK